jgi:RNA polymerase sigma-70 factor (ECF subfamily)
MKNATDLKTQSDEELMLAYGKGNAEAFDLLFVRHGQKIFNLFLRQTGNAELARDLTQETWVRLVDARHRYQPSKSFSSWLYTIAMNLLRDEIKRRKRHGLHKSLETINNTLQEPEAYSTEQKITAAEQKTQIQRAVQSLPKEQREVVLLAKYQELPYAKVAEILGISETAAKQRAWRGLQTLRSKLKKRDGENHDM